MKSLKFHRIIVAIAMMLIGWLPSLAHHFEINGIFYNKTSGNTVAVTYKGYYYDSYWVRSPIAYFFLSIFITNLSENETAKSNPGRGMRKRPPDETPL